MKTLFLDKKIDYNGSQLRSSWIRKTSGIKNDAMVAFIGGCNVLPEFMVDLEDKAAGCEIFSEEMLHFIIEHAEIDLEKMILRQRLLASIVIQAINKERPDISLIRSGNDIYDRDSKLNVSIATTSPVSGLIHFGINVSSENTPVKTKSLNDYQLNPKTFALNVMKEYKQELDGVEHARGKVKKVD